MDAQLAALIDLQQHDSRIAALEAEAARLPREAEAIEGALRAARATLDSLRARQEQLRRDLRTKEKDLDVITAKRTKLESRLYEVKTNKEYSAVLLEIEENKQEKAGVEEQTYALMEGQERVVVDILEAEQQHVRREEQAAREVSEVRRRLAAVETDLAAARAARATRTGDLPAALLSEYDRIRKARGGVAVASVDVAAVCSACRVTVRPQAIQELRGGRNLMPCETCGRFLVWQE